MQVILLEDMPKLGNIGDMVTVKDGYARNYLLPRSKALVASVHNVKKLEHEKRVAGFALAKARGGAEELASKLGTLEIKLARKVGDQGKLFGSVTSLDIERALIAEGFELDRRQLSLGDPVKELGAFEVSVKLHKEVTATLKVEVVAEQ